VKQDKDSVNWNQSQRWAVTKRTRSQGIGGEIKARSAEGKRQDEAGDQRISPQACSRTER
jgi:hypothetical protein